MIWTWYYIHFQAINLGKYSSASDVWSFGIVMYEIWSGAQMPYKNLDKCQVNYLDKVMEA